MNNVKARYGHYAPQKWDSNISLRKYFEQKMGMDIYEAIGQTGTKCV